MVDVGNEAETIRIAVADGFMKMTPETLTLSHDDNAKKGDVIDKRPAWPPNRQPISSRSATR